MGKHERIAHHFYAKTGGMQIRASRMRSAGYTALNHDFQYGQGRITPADLDEDTNESGMVRSESDLTLPAINGYPGRAAGRGVSFFEIQ